MYRWIVRFNEHASLFTRLDGQITCLAMCCLGSEFELIYPQANYAWDTKMLWKDDKKR